MAGNFEIRTDDAGNAAIRLRAAADTLPAEIKDAIEDAAGTTVSWIQAHAPRSSDATGHEHMADRARVGEVTYRPGGLGGGGYYEVDAGIPVIHPYDYPLAVYQGTGRYSTSRHTARDVIYPNRRSAMKFSWRGAIGYASWVRGQRPQQEWFDDAVEAGERELHLGMELLLRKKAGIFG